MQGTPAPKALTLISETQPRGADDIKGLMDFQVFKLKGCPRQQSALVAQVEAARDERRRPQCKGHWNSPIESWRRQPSVPLAVNE